MRLQRDGLDLIQFYDIHAKKYELWWISFTFAIKQM